MNHFFEQKREQNTKRVNDHLTKKLDHITDSGLKDAIKYSLLLPGKRIRPFLIYAVADLFDCDLNHFDSAASAIEIIHTYTLIHDDLPAMDNDDLRRGQPTCHVKFGDATAILAGDAMQSFAFWLITQDKSIDDAKKVKIISELALACGANKLCLGQFLDLQSQNKTIDINTLNLIHHNKTGALIISAITIAIHIAGDKASKYKTWLEYYAACIGLAFQIKDDILDVEGSTQILGKQAGADVKLLKNTYCELLGINQAKLECQKLYEQANIALDKIPYNTDLLHQLAEFIINREH